jgi:hypothetical protein
VGQAALLSTFPDSTKLLKYETAAERSLWVFQTHRDKFRQAEDIRYADQYQLSAFNYRKFKIANLYNMGTYISFQVKKVSL